MARGELLATASKGQLGRHLLVLQNFLFERADAWVGYFSSYIMHHMVLTSKLRQIAAC